MRGTTCLHGVLFDPGGSERECFILGGGTDHDNVRLIRTCVRRGRLGKEGSGTRKSKAQEDCAEGDDFVSGGREEKNNCELNVHTSRLQVVSSGYVLPCCAGRLFSDFWSMRY